MALGRGLGELLGEIETAYENNNETLTNNNDILDIPLGNIILNPYQPRKMFDQQKLQELSESIKTNGLLQPIVVTSKDDKYMLIAGERRYRATKLAQFDTIKAIVIDVEESKLRELALIENIQRDDLNIIEVANSYAGLINDYGITHEELSKIVSKSRSSITNILRVLTLCQYAQDMLLENKITLGHAKVIIGLDHKQQKIVIESIIGQRLSVRDTELLVKKIKSNQDDIKKDIKKVDYNISQLEDMKEKLIKNNLKVKIDNNYFKIKIESQADIENILKHFRNI